MRITSLRAFRADLKLKEGPYQWASGHHVSVFDTTIVEILTDSGIRGYGECCPLGSAYLPAYAAGVRAGLIELAPHVMGLDPRDLGALNRTMDGALKGHAYVKSAIDVACWDILGKACGIPVYRLLGGLAQEDVRLYRAISQADPELMAERIGQYRAEGYRAFQLKVGGECDRDVERIRACSGARSSGDLLIGDANTGWTMHEAARVVAAVGDLDVYIEQPCPTYRECRAVRDRTSLPMILDEIIDGVEMLVTTIGDRAMDAINLKISKVGGLTKARLIRDLCVDAGIPMIIEDTWGGDIVTATIAQLAQSTPEEFLLCATDFNSYVDPELAHGAPKRLAGRMRAGSGPGLGVDPIPDRLGAPVVVVGE